MLMDISFYAPNNNLEMNPIELIFGTCNAMPKKILQIMYNKMETIRKLLEVVTEIPSDEVQIHICHV